MSWQRTPPILSPRNVKDLRRDYRELGSISKVRNKWGINRRTIRHALYGLGAYAAPEYRELNDD